ncbi:polysaccharide pyruvyl transferase family protein [Microbacterium sp. NPDC055683]
MFESADRTPDARRSSLASSARRMARDALLRSGATRRSALRRIAGALAGFGDAVPFEQRTRVVLVAPPGGGNIGDQAMVEAFLDNVGGDVTVVASSERAFSFAGAHAEQADVVVLPGLLYGTVDDRRRDLARFARLLADARWVVVLGADTMDGHYQPRASVMRAVVAEAAVRAGASSRILGFSWSEEPRGAARSSLRAARRAGVQILPRDPVSAERLRADGIAPTRTVADVVFAATGVDRAARDELGLTGPYAVVNVSGGIARRADLVADYAVVVRRLRDLGLRVVVLPHVVGTAVDDRAASEALRRAVPEGVAVVERALAPAEVRGLVDGAEIVVTGRMHLAVMALPFATPAVVLASQGKVEGLMALAGTPEMCVRPRVGLGADVVRLVEAALPAGSPARTSIAAAVPVLRGMAADGFRGLPARAGGGAS